MTEKWTNPRQNNDVASGCLRYVFALLIVFWIVFVAYVAIYAGSVSESSPLARGATGLLLLSLAGGWKVAARWPTMRLALVFAFGLLGVLVAAGELIIQLAIYHIDSRPVAIGVLLIALVAISVLFRWTVLRSSELKTTTTNKEPPDGT